MLKKVALTILLVAGVFFADAKSQTAVAPEKQAAIRQLVALVNADNKVEDIMAVVTLQMEVSQRATFKALLDERTDLTAAERKAIEDSFASDREVSLKRFQEKFTQKLNFSALIDEISAAVYDKHFTLEEIRDLIAFYKTPTGKKALRLMAPIMNDTMQAFNEKLAPKLPVIIKEIEEDIRREAEEKINAAKPRPKKPATR
jgi:uncharacterized protein